MFRRWLAGSLSIVHLHVLTILEADGPLSMGKLAEALDVSVASATGIVDRMEQRGLVERRPRRRRPAGRARPADAPPAARSSATSTSSGGPGITPDPRAPHRRRARRASSIGLRAMGAARAALAAKPQRHGELEREPPDDRPLPDLPPAVRGPLALVLVLLLIQAIGNLYLPDLNADIINNGVAKGDNDYILRTGALMLVVTALLGDRRGHRRLLGRAGRDGLRARRAERDLRARSRRSRRSRSTASARRR